MRKPWGKRYARKPWEPQHAPALFVPLPLADSGSIIVPEGLSDTIALVSLGFPAIGRSTAKVGDFEMNALRAFTRGRDVVVLGENDERPDARRLGGVFWPAKEGAEDAARGILLSAKSVRIAFPPTPHNDARAMLRAVGADRARDLLRATIEASLPIELHIAGAGGVR